MDRPNLLLLFTDQQRADTVAALGNPLIRTPALDRLVREGTTFTRGYSPCPVCMPARAAMLTGLPPHVTGCVDNRHFPIDRTSLMTLLGRWGYETHGVGKMHFAPDYRASWGFEGRDTSEELKADTDYRRMLQAKGFAHVLEPFGSRGELYYSPQPSQLPARLHESSWVADRAVDFLARRDRSRPFFLMASFVKPHPPFESPSPWHRLYRTVEMPAPHWPSNSADYLSRINRVQNRYKYCDRTGRNDLFFRTVKAAYYAAISFLDYNLARILSSLEDAGDLDRTLIVFASDHGEMLGDYGAVGKRCMLEASARIPLIVRHPPSFSAGKKVATPATLLDLFPTFAAAAGIPSTESSPHPEGVALQQFANASDQRRIVFAQFERGWMGHYLATDGRFKYMYSAPDRREWLFRVRDALVEGPDLAHTARYSTEKMRLKEALRRRYARDHVFGVFTRDDWTRYRAKSFSKNPDYGLLRQDEDELQARIDALGPLYARPVTEPDAAKEYQILSDHSA